MEQDQVIKARHCILRLSPEDQERLKAVQQEAARCWNDILASAKTHYDAGNGWISKDSLQKALKKSYRLHSQTVQGLTDRFCANRLTAAENRRQGLNTRYPWREKKFVTIPFKQMAIKRSATGTLKLTLSAKGSIDIGLIIPFEINTCEILWRKGRYILSYTSEYPDTEPVSGIRAGIDIGEIHPVAVVAENGTGLVVSGREIRAVKQQRNKSLGLFSRALSRCTKGSRRWKKLIRAKGSLKGKTDAQVRDLLHKATRKAINWCLFNGVGELVIGNPAGVEKNTKKKKRLRRKSRQKVSQMETGRIKQYLRYKAKESGIASCLVGERGTSSTCPECGHVHTPKGRTFRCPECGFAAHRDGKAGFMMLWKKHPTIPLPESFKIQHMQSFPKYRKPACVDGPDVVLSSLAIADSLLCEYLAV